MTKKKEEKQGKDNDDVRLQFIDKISALLTSGFGLVAALAWNDAIKALFETIPFKKTELWAKFAYALFITIFIVVFIYQFNRISTGVANVIKKSQKKEKKAIDFIAKKLIKARDSWKKKLKIAKSADKSSTKTRARK